MWRALVVVIAFDSASRADPCLPPAKYEAALAAATKVNDERAAAELAKRKLAIANLPHATWKAEHRKVDGVIEERDLGGKRATYVLVAEVQCFTRVELVTGDSKVYRLERKPTAGKTTK